MTTTTDHTCHGAMFCGTPRTRAQADCPACPTTRVYATDRDEADSCQAGTPGCSIDHSADNGSCETW
jgi:hypothetical protein